MQDEVSRVVLALESPEVAEEVMHFLDRSGRARVVGTALDERQLTEAVKQLEPDAVVAAPGLVPSGAELNGSALLAVDTSQSVATLRRALRAGASGFFLWPAEREDLAIAAGRARPVVDPASTAHASVIAVVGARGGIGATFVATHLAAAFAAEERRCVLVDLDLAFGELDGPLGVPGEEGIRTIGDLVPLGDEVSPTHVAEVLWRHPAGFGVLLAQREGGPVARAATVRSAIGAARSIAEVVVLSVPRSLDEEAHLGFELADRVVVVVGLDVLSLRGAKRLIDAAALDGRVDVVVNRASRSEITPADVERVLGREPVAVVPSDGRVGTAQQRGQLVPFRGRLGRQLRAVAAALVDTSP